MSPEPSWAGKRAGQFEPGSVANGTADPALSCNWTWVQTAGSRLDASIRVDGAIDGHAQSAICQIVCLSKIAGGDS